MSLICPKCNQPKCECAKLCRLCANKEHSIRMSGSGNSMAGTHRIGSLNPFYGKKHSAETKEHLSTVKKRLGYIRGRKNPMYGVHRYGSLGPGWKGGVSYLNSVIRNSKKYAIWRSKVFKRDNYTCQICGEKSTGNIEADHIIPFSKLLRQYNINSILDAANCRKLWYIKNGRTLCIRCHKKTDTYGWRSFNQQKIK